jgi:membrane-associated phospholipid phosphatase
MKLLIKVVSIGMSFCAALGFCISATAQTPLVSDHLADPATIAQQEPLPNRPIQDVAVRSTQAEDVYGIFNRKYGELLLDDVTHTITAPSRWGPDEWRQIGFAGAVILGTGILLDRPIRDAAQRNRRHSLDRVANLFEPFGREYSLGVLGGFYLVGAVNNDATAMQVAQDGVASSIIASVIITPVLQRVVGRSRPRANEGVANFRPFSGGNPGFPSGHATQAFAVASVIASHYDDTPWVKTVAYGTASLVGFARVYHNAHFTSDVLAGGLIGTFVGHSVVAFNKQQRTSKVSFMPMLAPGTTGLMMQIRF